MNYNQSCAAKGEQGQQARQFYGAARNRHLQMRSLQRAAVNIYRTDRSYEVLVFAPGRIKEQFNLKVEGNKLVVSYTPPVNFPRPEWVQREYSRGGFERSFVLDESIDASSITAKYVDGVLQVSLPVVPGRESTAKEIVID